MLFCIIVIFFIIILIFITSLVRQFCDYVYLHIHKASAAALTPNKILPHLKAAVNVFSYTKSIHVSSHKCKNL